MQGSDTSIEEIDGCSLVHLPVVHDARGNLSFVEGEEHVPFPIRRIYYLYDVPGGEARAGHAHHGLQQLILALSGSFDVLLDDGFRRRTITLRRANIGVLVTKTTWREIYNFSSGSVCLVLASQHFDESDYIRDYSAFQVAVHGNATQATPAIREIDGDQYTA